MGLAVGAARPSSCPSSSASPWTGTRGSTPETSPCSRFPFLIAFFLWKRRRAKALSRGRLAAFGGRGASWPTHIPYTPRGHTELLVAIHLPIALWLMVGRAYAASRWNDGAGRMDFVRFSGELVIYYALIARAAGS